MSRGDKPWWAKGHGGKEPAGRKFPYDPDPDLLHSVPPQVRQAIAAIPSHSPGLGDLDISLNGKGEVKTYSSRNHSQAQLRALVPSSQQRRLAMSEFDEFYDEDERRDPNQITEREVADYQKNMQRGQHLQNLSNAKTFRERLEQFQQMPGMKEACEKAGMTVEQLATFEVNNPGGAGYLYNTLSQANLPHYLQGVKDIQAGKQPFAGQPHDPMMPDPAAPIPGETMEDLKALDQAQKEGKITSDQKLEAMMAKVIGPKG